MQLQSFQNQVSRAILWLQNGHQSQIVRDMLISLGTAVLPSNVMSSNQNKGVTTILSCSNTASVIPKPVVKSSPTVAMNTKVNIAGDKSSS